MPPAAILPSQSLAGEAKAPFKGGTYQTKVLLKAGSPLKNPPSAHSRYSLLGKCVLLAAFLPAVSSWKEYGSPEAEPLAV